MGILIQNKKSKFSKNKNQTQNNPLKFLKIKNIYKEASNQKVSYNRPPKSGNFDSKYSFEIFNKQKSNSKKAPLKFQKIKNLYKEASHQKVL